MSFLTTPSSPHALRNLGRGTCYRFMILAVLWLVMITESSRALAQSAPSPMPEFTGARVYVSGVPDEYRSLRDDIAKLEKSSPQTYYVVVVRSTGSGRKATRGYLETMIERWESQARSQKAAFDTKRSVVILLAIENRQIIVLGGEELQERLGFRDPYIERDLIQPHFISYARSKDYARGLHILLGQIDRWINERDKTLAGRREEAAAREAQLKGDAQAALQTSKRVLEEARKQVEAHQAKGLNVETYQKRVRRAAEDVDIAARRLNTSASESLDLAQEAERDLQLVLDELQRITSRQTEIDESLQKTSALAAEVLKAIEAAGHENLPVAPVQAELDNATTQIDEARKALKSDPDRAEMLANQVAGKLRETLAHVKELPDLRHNVEQKAKALTSLERSTKALLDRARSAGVEAQDLTNDWSKANNALVMAREKAGTDDRLALDSFKQAETTLVDLREKAQARLARHVVYTRTIPLMILGLIAACALAIFGALWYRKRRLQGILDVQFKGFREKAVSLMDRLDALRQRHKTLPATDPDYTQPLAGATLALYQDVEKQLNGLWERWLGVMDVWDRAQKLVRTGQGLAVSKTEEAKALIEKQGNVDELSRACDACEQQLNQLNQAHEQSRDALKSARDEETKLQKTLETIGQARLPVDAYAKDLATINALFTQAEGLLKADPIGAGEVAGHSREALEAVIQRAGQILANVEASKTLQTALDGVAARAAQLRSEGLKLSEASADPDQGLAAARTKQAAALDALRAADPVAAASAIAEARSLVETAKQGIDAHLQARDAVGKELPLARESLIAIHQGINQASASLEHLRQSFAESSWTDVAGNLDRARRQLETNEALLARAGEEASEDVQNYRGAAATLAEFARGRSEIDRLLQAVVGREMSLNELATQSRASASGLEAEIRQAENFFRENEQALGVEAHSSLDRARAAYRELSGALQQRLPNWPLIQRQLAAVKQGIAVAVRQGQEDVDCYRRVTQKLTLVKQKAQALGSMLGREEKDRPPANQRFRAAVDVLNSLENGAGDRSDWDLLLRQLDEVDANLNRAEALAQEDISLANGAIAEISQADRTIRTARAFYEIGVTADVSEAESQLNRARGALASSAYEQAIELANAAERSANEAHEQAAHEARRRRMRVEREQVFTGPDASLIIAAAQAAAQAAGHWVGSQARAEPPNPSPSFPPPTPQSNPDPGSWGSGGDSGGWTKGADQASW